jgi:hypothetical protein
MSTGWPGLHVDRQGFVTVALSKHDLVRQHSMRLAN